MQKNDEKNINIQHYQQKIDNAGINFDDPTGAPWYNYYYYGGLAGKTTSAWDKICSFLLLKYPDYLAHIESNKDSPDRLFNPSVTFLPFNNTLSFYGIFTAIQSDLEYRLGSILDSLVNQLAEPEFGLLCSNLSHQQKKEFKNYCRNWLQGIQDPTDPIKPLLYNNNTDALNYYLRAATELLKQKEIDAKASLKTIKKAINQLAHDYGKLGRLTKHANFRITPATPLSPADSDTEEEEEKKHPGTPFPHQTSVPLDYCVVRDEESLNSSLQEHEKNKKTKKLIKKTIKEKAFWKGISYPLVRSVTATVGCAAIFSALTGIDILPTAAGDIAIMLIVALMAFSTTYYSNYFLALSSAEYFKAGGFLPLLYEFDESPAPQVQSHNSMANATLTQKKKNKTKKMKCLDTTIISVLTAGVISIYGFPFMIAINRLDDIWGGVSELYLAIGVIGGIWLAWAALQIFLPQISKFVRKMTSDAFKTPREFFQQELIRPVQVGNGFWERVSLFCQHTIPNFLRIVFVGLCIGVANYATWSSLTSSIINTAGFIPGLEDNFIITVFAWALIIANSIACAIFVQDKLYTFAKKITPLNWLANAFQWKFFMSPVENNLAALQQCAQFQRTTQAQGTIPIKMKAHAVTGWVMIDFFLRFLAALFSNIGTIGTATSSASNPALELSKGTAAATVSALNKFVTIAPPGLDGGETPKSTYSKIKANLDPSPKHSQSSPTKQINNEENILADFPKGDEDNEINEFSSTATTYHSVSSLRGKSPSTPTDSLFRSHSVPSYVEDHSPTY